jgi:hypothetical protein
MVGDVAENKWGNAKLCHTCQRSSAQVVGSPLRNAKAFLDAVYGLRQHYRGQGTSALGVGKDLFAIGLPD